LAAPTEIRSNTGR